MKYVFQDSSKKVSLYPTLVKLYLVGQSLPNRFQTRKRSAKVFFFQWNLSTKIITWSKPIKITND